MINVKFFGAAREIVGAGEREFELPEMTTAGAAFEIVLNEFPALREKFGKSLLLAVNQNYANGDEIINDGDELAIFPPVSGGSGEIRNPKSKIQNESGDYEITLEPLDVGAIARKVVPPECGAIVTLDGFVRQFTKQRETLYLIYEAYEPMALIEMQKIGAQAKEQFDIAHVTIVHRLGKLEIGETSVVISVASPHRRAAFTACEWLIKELKRVVPIWKQEFYRDEQSVKSIWPDGENQILE